MTRNAALIAGFSLLLGAQLWASPARAYDGCLGAQVRACVDAIRPHLTDLDYSLAVQSIERFLAGDIAGKRKSKGIVTFPYRSAFADALEPTQLMAMEFAPSLQIDQIEISLRKGASSAETEAEYQATHMYETALFALGSHEACGRLATAHDFYLFFHQQVRPKLKEAKAERTKADFKPAAEYSGDTGWISFCGKSFLKLVVTNAEWGAAQANMDRKFNASSASLVFR